MARVETEEQIRILARLSEEVIPEDELIAKLEKDRPLRVKYGMDPTAPDIHLGNAIALHKLRVFQDLGHLPVIIVGDYTARVGDPSEANRTRPVLSPETIEANAATYFDQVGRIVDLDRAEVRRNGEWFEKMHLDEVVRIASRMTVARTIERDDFAKRLANGSPIGVHELLYPVMQAWDSVMVRADVEIGGTDQKFNLLAAREFQRAEGQEPQVVMTHPLLVGLDGVRKMSKSLSNYVGITEPPEEIFGKVMSIPDTLMGAYALWTTDLGDDRIGELLDPERTHPRDAKGAIATAVVERYHGAEAAKAAAAEFERVFSKKEEPEAMAEIEIGSGALTKGRIWIVELVVKAGFAPSNSDARRLVSQGAVSLDGKKVEGVGTAVKVRGGEVLRVGRRRFARLRV